jgi:hypothetical protein
MFRPLTRSLPDGYRNAVALLQEAQTAKGFVASPVERDNYKRVWTRDGVVTGIAALMTGDDRLIATFHHTLTTIFKYQHKLGFIASNVTFEGVASYGGTVGRADNPSWAVIGLCEYTTRTGDVSLKKNYAAQVEKCFHVLDVWEFNGKHLVYVPQSGDWADEYIYHGYLLFVQLLRVWALRLAGTVYDREDWHAKAAQIVEVIRRNFWYTEDTSKLYSPNLSHQLAEAPRKHWLMGFNPSRIYRYFDLQANTLALGLDIGSHDENRTLRIFIQDMLNERKSILPSFSPAITEDENDMAELKTNFAYGFRNYPNEFHNAGLWPVWNGLLSAALAKAGYHETASLLTDHIHAANALENWEFNECLHGVNGKPIGVKRCTWSAAGAVIAERALEGYKLFQKFT